MLKKIDDNFTLTSDKIELIKRNGKIHKKSWDESAYIDLRSSLEENLENNQLSKELPRIGGINFYECGYCGLLVNDTGRGEVEHIALKSKYPEFSFYSKNLIIVCSHCNSSSKKGKKEIGYIEKIGEYEIDEESVSYLNDVVEAYSKVRFNFVHPKQDDPDVEIKWMDKDKFIVDINNSTDKGRSHINLFKLDDAHMTMARIRLHRQKEDYRENPEEYLQILKYTKKY